MYQLNTGHYLCRNKYYGRGLSIEGFREALFQFLHNGRGLRQDLLEPILHKLRSLKAVLEKQASYRFYSSSLLVIYEGQVRQEVHLPLPWLWLQLGPVWLRCESGLGRTLLTGRWPPPAQCILLAHSNPEAPVNVGWRRPVARGGIAPLFMDGGQQRML